MKKNCFLFFRHFSVTLNVSFTIITCISMPHRLSVFVLHLEASTVNFQVELELRISFQAWSSFVITNPNSKDLTSNNYLRVKYCRLLYSSSDKQTDGHMCKTLAE